MRTLTSCFGAIGLLLVLTAACGGSKNAEEPATAADVPTPEPGATPEATTASETSTPKALEVPIQAKSGSKLTGKAVLTEAPDGVKVVLSVENVSPGEHGAHVHEKGDCSAEDGSSAGGHFNPGGHPHALPSGSPRHLGDFGNITVNADGKGTLELVAAGANLKDGDPSSFLGKAIIVHEKKDDGGQPTGNAGGRIGCAELK
jgi:Cu-Zn family superoxide dismutase